VTVIAWDGKALAGDRLADYGGTRIRVRKVNIVSWRGQRWLVGAAGSKPIHEAWLRWLRGGDKPAINDSHSFTALLVDEKRRAWQMEWTLEMWRVPHKFHAVGSGRGEALGAMAMGANAQRAVQIAALFDIGVGLGVDVVRF
jgi:hypothetical protein